MFVEGDDDYDIMIFAMILFTRLWGLSHAYKDGMQSRNSRFDAEIEQTKKVKLTPAMLDRKVRFLPDIIEFTSFVFFSPTAVGGSFYEYKDYINFIEQRGHYSNMPSGLVQGWKTLIPCL